MKTRSAKKYYFVNLMTVAISLAAFPACNHDANGEKARDGLQQTETGKSSNEGTPSNDSPKGDTVASAGGGSEVGNGGDSWSVDFVSSANRVVDELERMEVKDRYGVDPDALAAAIESTKVESTEENLFLDGVQKTAINYPEKKKILLSRPSWVAENNMVVKRKLVLHEFLGIMKIDDRNYQISSKVYAHESAGLNACQGAEGQLRADAIALFRRRGHPISDDNLDTGNDVNTLLGGYIRVIRGYETGKEGYVSALMTIAECDPRSGRYVMRSNSASGANLMAVCPGSSKRYCPQPQQE